MSEPSAEPQVRLPVAVAVVLGAVVLTLVVVGGVLALPAHTLASGPAIAPPTDDPVLTSTTFTVDGRQVSYHEFRATVPPAPFTCRPVTVVQGTFLSYVPCSTLVRQDYDGQGHDSFAALGLVLLDPTKVDRDSIASTSSRLFDLVEQGLYRTDLKRTVTNRKGEALDGVAGQGRSYATYGDVSYELADGSTTHDRVFVAPIQLGGGSTVAFFSINPTLSTAATKKQLQDVFTSMSTR